MIRRAEQIPAFTPSPGRMSRRSFVALGAAGVAAAASFGRTTAAARVATPTPTAAMERERLFIETFAGDSLPQGEKESVFYRLTLEPGAALPNPAGPFCGCGGQSVVPGVGVEVVVSGSYGVTSDAPVWIRQEADGPAEEVAPGTELTLGPGRIVIFPDYATSGAFRNSGDEPVVIFGVAILASEVSDGTPAPDLPEGARAEQLSRVHPYDWEKLSAGPVSIQLSRTVLPSGEAWPAAEIAGLETIHIETGQIDFGLIPRGEDEASSLMTYRTGQTTAMLPLGPGVRRIIENSGDEPASLLVLSIVPEEESGATPAAEP